MPINNSYFLNPAHLELAKARYFLKDGNGNLIENDIEEVFNRVVNHIYSNEQDSKHKEEALKYRLEKKIIDAGRILAQAGTNNKNLFNCFVLSFADDTREAISDLKRKHFSIEALGGGVGINFSTLRPNGSICKTTQSRSSGAVGFITDFSYQSSNICQNGNRSGANLGALEDWHPDLYEFITKKSVSNWENIRKFSSVYNEDEFAYFQWNHPHMWQMFNVSVFLSDDFMNKVTSNSKEPWKLKWKNEEWHLWDFTNTSGPKSGQKYLKHMTVVAPNEEMAKYKASSQIPYFKNTNMILERGPYDLTAKELFRLICKSAHSDGCPGVVFYDLAKKYHNGEYFNPISATNPCAEEPLPTNGVCCLTSLILPSFFKGGEFDYDDFRKAIWQAVRGLDNIIDLSKTGEPDIDANNLRERRIGLGTTGIAELLILKKVKYSSETGRKFVAEVLEFMRDEAYGASIALAKERGAFKAFEYEGFSKSEFFKTLPEDIKNDIKTYGIRNVTILTQAPSGTTGTMIGYSQGCEPYFLMCFDRNSRVGTFRDGSPTFMSWLKDNDICYEKYDYNLDKLRNKEKVPKYFEESLEISSDDHLKMQAVFSKYVDSSVSKTVNLPSDATIEDVESAYIQAYKMGIKSTTVYRYGSKEQVLEHVKKEEKDSKPVSIVDAHSPDRPDALECDIHHTSVKGEKWTVLVGLLHGKPYELFCAPQDAFEISEKYDKARIVKDGKMFYLETDDFKLKNISGYLKTDEHRVITRLISTCLRYGVPTSFISEQLAKADGTVVDFSKAMLRVLRKYESVDVNTKDSAHTCSKCGSTNIVINGGCPECLDCGTSKCG